MKLIWFVIGAIWTAIIVVAYDLLLRRLVWIEVNSLLLTVYQTDKERLDFLNTPCPNLDCHCPIDLINAGYGLLVVDLLSSIGAAKRHKILHAYQKQERKEI